MHVHQTPIWFDRSPREVGQPPRPADSAKRAAFESLADLRVDEREAERQKREQEQRRRAPRQPAVEEQPPAAQPGRINVVT